MKENREKLIFTYQPIDNKDVTENDIKLLSKHFLKIVNDDKLSPGFWSFNVEK